MNITNREILEKITNDHLLKVVLWLLIFSYFYNLPVLYYSIKGENELRLYDFLGVVLFLRYFQYFKYVNLGINKVVFLKRFRDFAVYCSISIILTLIFMLFKNNFVKFVQSFLYLYHMWVFFLGAVFLYFYLSNTKRYTNIFTFITVLVLAESIVVIGQNVGVIPFLWSDDYYIGYHGFLSGTVGPNKIVIGMTMLISLILLLGILYEKKLKVPKYLIYAAITGAVITILLSGSRTTYLGVGVFLVYFMVKRTARFMQFAVMGSFFLVAILFYNPTILDRISDTLNGRIIDRIDSPDDIKSADDFTGLYENLGAGRMELHENYVHFLLNNPILWPVGQGFNNRSGIGYSAHNMYLTLIAELGIFGLVLYFRWLFSYLVIVKRKLPNLQMAVNGIVFAMMVTLYFGEHLYVYRPLFGILGFFMIACVLLLAPLRNTS
ncbi:O-antigen ligase family protein [Marixanthomonas ophiurae]|uniref:O-antigen ligase domain-containing protein n=1 Tax=Marixanthomonas ophiurae TaxID=387659 RepID=A0A3E1QD28_9FLAO|nr:O-antigen ligase family protein [Marixanthomonas ophiurae]RFN60060.1 O-antigen ligase domain-containing protein [Marixanthomonas ophiurae]